MKHISKIATAHCLCLKISHDFCSNHSWKGLWKRTRKMIHADSVCFNFERLFVPLKRVKIDVSANWPMKTSSHCPCVTAGEAGWTFLMQVSGAVCPSLQASLTQRAKQTVSVASYTIRVHCGMRWKDSGIQLLSQACAAHGASASTGFAHPVAPWCLLWATVSDLTITWLCCV